MKIHILKKFCLITLLLCSYHDLLSQTPAGEHYRGRLYVLVVNQKGDTIFFDRNTNSKIIGGVEKEQGKKTLIQ